MVIERKTNRYRCRGTDRPCRPVSDGDAALPTSRCPAPPHRAHQRRQSTRVDGRATRAQRSWKRALGPRPFRSRRTTIVHSAIGTRRECAVYGYSPGTGLAETESTGTPASARRIALGRCRKILGTRQLCQILGHPTIVVVRCAGPTILTCHLPSCPVIVDPAVRGETPVDTPRLGRSRGMKAPHAITRTSPVRPASLGLSRPYWLTCSRYDTLGC